MSIAVRPFCLKDAPSLIERLWPTGKISAEAQKERKAGAGQTLTGLGSYWKGRKPLILVRACVLGSLLPVTDHLDKDLEIFEKLMAIDDEAFDHRVKDDWDGPNLKELPYSERMDKALRPEELPESAYSDVWGGVNAHLGTDASSFESLVEQLGIMRFGHRPIVADPFCGGGSIPYEAARLGCNAYSSDLNPIACMLTWGALNIVGADDGARKSIEADVERVAESVDRKVTELKIEHDEHGNRAKTFLYCLEVRCPNTGWLVPLLPSLVISGKRNVVAKLIPDPQGHRYEIEIVTGVTPEEMKAAEEGTVRGKRVYHPMSNNELGFSITDIRGDYSDADGTSRNRLRPWEKSDFLPRKEDVFQERLYCIQWITKETLTKGRQKTFFAAPTTRDIEREEKVNSIVRENLMAWQESGLIPNMRIEPGKNTSQPIWERGWTYWHHLFCPRHLLLLAYLKREIGDNPSLLIPFCSVLDFSSKLTSWINSGRSEGGSEFTAHVFANQALNTLLNYGQGGLVRLLDTFKKRVKVSRISGVGTIENHTAAKIAANSDIFITDPPYADAVNYHEITEFFISWLRHNPGGEFSKWEWDSRRVLAIQGDGQEFRSGMVNAYRAMTEHMPDNGIQIVMFTHQSGKVWSDMAQIFWGAGLQVVQDWYIATETTSELKKGGYVQGTHIIVARKRNRDMTGYSDEITQEVKAEVADQIETMVGLNQGLKGNGRMENLFEDVDLQMAGYAAALRVLTKYTRIDGRDMTVEALRPRSHKDRTVVDEIVEFAVQVANEHLVPDGMESKTWERRRSAERFYLKMLDIESGGLRKLDNYQNFAKAFRVNDYAALMADLRPNHAQLKSAADFGKRMVNEDHDFGSSATRGILYALWEMSRDTEDDVVLAHLRDMVPDYLEQRSDLQAIASYIALKRNNVSPDEARNARILAGLIKNERIG